MCLCSCLSVPCSPSPRGLIYLHFFFLLIGSPPKYLWNHSGIGISDHEGLHSDPIFPSVAACPSLIIPSCAHITVIDMSSSTPHVLWAPTIGRDRFEKGEAVWWAIWVQYVRSAGLSGPSVAMSPRLADPPDARYRLWSGCLRTRVSTRARSLTRGRVKQGREGGPVRRRAYSAPVVLLTSIRCRQRHETPHFRASKWEGWLVGWSVVSAGWEGRTAFVQTHARCVGVSVSGTPRSSKLHTASPGTVQDQKSPEGPAAHGSALLPASSYMHAIPVSATEADPQASATLQGSSRAEHDIHDARLRDQLRTVTCGVNHLHEQAVLSGR